MICYFSVTLFDTLSVQIEKNKKQTLHVSLINIRKDAGRIASCDKYCDLD